MRILMVGPFVDCDATTIQGALKLVAPETPAKILICPGTYHERVQVYGQHLTLIGIGRVVITADRYARQLGVDGHEYGTFRTATVYVNGEDIRLENLTIQNTAGTGVGIGQAIALFAEGKRLTFDQVTLDAFQDTLCLGPLPPLQKDHTPFVSEKRWREYVQQDFTFSGCTIKGTVDFIFGGGNAHFTHCWLQSRKRTGTGVNYLTAASTPKGQPGFTFSDCVVASEAAQPYWLGRPWREYAKTRFERCWFGRGLTAPAWGDWHNVENQKTVTYVERDCHDEVAVPRAAWVDTDQEEE